VSTNEGFQGGEVEKGGFSFSSVGGIGVAQGKKHARGRINREEKKNRGPFSKRGGEKSERRRLIRGVRGDFACD